MELYLPQKKRAEALELKKKMYVTMAKVALKYGPQTRQGYTHSQIYEFWDYECDSPSIKYFHNRVSVTELKKVIKNAIKVNHNIWNGDFLQGLAKNCQMFNSDPASFPSLRWRNNREINKIVEACPFGGIKGRNFRVQSPKLLDNWSFVPALDLSYTEYTPSFVAGILSAGEIVYKDGYYYSKHNDKVVDEIKKLKIPIEEEVKIGKFKGYDHHVLISPFWGALFSLRMPEEIRAKWFNLENAKNAHLYSAMMWHTYINTKFKKRGLLPYLKSRRMIFYEYKCEEGAMKKLEKLRFEMNLTELDYSVRDIVKEWANIQ